MRERKRERERCVIVTDDYTCMSGLSVRCIWTHFCNSNIYVNCVLSYTKYGCIVFNPTRLKVPHNKSLKRWVRKVVGTGGGGLETHILIYVRHLSYMYALLCKVNVIPQNSAVFIEKKTLTQNNLFISSSTSVCLSVCLSLRAKTEYKKSPIT